MKFSITTWQRITLFQIIGSLQGNVAMVRKAAKALDVLEMSDEDKVLIGYTELPNGAARWNDQDHRFELEIKDRETAELVKQKAKEHSAWPAMMGKHVLDLFERLGIEDE